MANNPRELIIQRVELPDMMFIGLPVNVSFKHGDFDKIGQVKETFMRRRAEIPDVADAAHYYAPWFNCEVMFTYFYCMRVGSLDRIPEGMMGFAIPSRVYLQAQYDGGTPFDPDPYGELHKYREAHGLRENKSAMIIEKYAFANEGLDGRLVVDVLGPLEA